MFFIGKKTIYLSLYQEGEKVESAGFLQISETQDRLKIAIQIKNIAGIEDAAYEIFAGCGEEKLRMGSLFIKGGAGYFEKNFCTSNNGIRVEGRFVPLDSLKEIMIQLPGTKKISGSFVQEKNTEPIAEIQTEEKEQPVLHPSRQPVCLKQERMVTCVSECLYANKWEQILNRYSKIHPFGDERVFVSLKLQELVILPEKYQMLMHNSFLLHGFYGYRHLILGKDYRLGSKMEKCFYLGVPGVYFEREKQVAVMFGFEGFECAGPVEVGKFGYYVREVAI